jgi:hypothetical protein
MMFFVAQSSIAPVQEAFNFWMLILTAVTILAILAGPILAIQVDRWISKRESVRRRKNAIFETLMTTRATAMVLDHVRALQFDFPYLLGLLLRVFSSLRDSTH